MSDENLTEQIETLKDLFFKRLAKETPKCEGGFHLDDIARVKSNKQYLKLFLEHNSLNMTNSLEMLWDTLIWRKTNGTNELSEKTVKLDYLKAGIMFAHNTDIDGKELLIFKAKHHVKGTKDMTDVMRVVVYWIERVFRRTNFDQLTLFFDMQGAGLSNMDVELVRRIVDTFKLYYPNSLNYIIIYDMAWILNAAFKIIKGFLPPQAVMRLKLLTPKTIGEYIPEKSLLKCWGGSDDYQFQFEPEIREIKELTADENSNDFRNENNNEILSNPKKVVHFASPIPSATHKISNMDDMYTSKKSNMLHMNPSDIIDFKGTNDVDASACVEITCTSSRAISYKIKTTSPDKFLVRPCSGALAPGASVTINVILQQRQKLTPTTKDKFLFMCMELPEHLDITASPQQISDLWKSKPNAAGVEQYRMRCQISNKSMGDTFQNATSSPSANAVQYESSDDKWNIVSDSISQMSNQNQRLEKRLRSAQNLQWMTLFIIFILSLGVIYILKMEVRLSCAGCRGDGYENKL